MANILPVNLGQYNTEKLDGVNILRKTELSQNKIICQSDTPSAAGVGEHRPRGGAS